MKAKLIQKYINLYSHKIATQNALWQRYTSSQLSLGIIVKKYILLAYAICNNW